MKAVFSLRFMVVLCCILLDMLVLFGFALWFLSEFIWLARAAGTRFDCRESFFSFFARSSLRLSQRLLLNGALWDSVCSIVLLPRFISCAAARPSASFVCEQFVQQSRCFLQRRAPPLPIIETQKSPWNVSDVDRRETGSVSRKNKDVTVWVVFFFEKKHF